MRDLVATKYGRDEPVHGGCWTYHKGEESGREGNRVRPGRGAGGRTYLQRMLVLRCRGWRQGFKGDEVRVLTVLAAWLGRGGYME